MTRLDFTPLSDSFPYFEILLKVRGYAAYRAQEDTRDGAEDRMGEFPDDNVGRLICQAYDLAPGDVLSTEPADRGARAAEVLVAYLETLNQVRAGLGQEPYRHQDLAQLMQMTASVAAEDDEIQRMQQALLQRDTAHLTA